MVVKSLLSFIFLLSMGANLSAAIYMTTDDYLSIATINDVTSGDHTIFGVASIASGSDKVFYANSQTNASFRVSNVGGKLTCTWGGVNDIQSNITVNTSGTPFAFVITRTGASLNYYYKEVGGSLQTNSQTSFGSPSASNGAAYIGRSHGGEYMNGRIFEIGVANTKWTQFKAELYINARLAGLAADFSDCKMYWVLDGQPDGSSADGDTYVDRCGGYSAVGNDGANNSNLTSEAQSVLLFR